MMGFYYRWSKASPAIFRGFHLTRFCAKRCDLIIAVFLQKISSHAEAAEAGLRSVFSSAFIAIHGDVLLF